VLSDCGLLPRVISPLSWTWGSVTLVPKAGGDDDVVACDEKRSQGLSGAL
jgi:hypothetical protein